MRERCSYARQGRGASGGCDGTAGATRHADPSPAARAAALSRHHVNGLSDVYDLVRVLYWLPG